MFVLEIHVTVICHSQSTAKGTCIYFVFIGILDLPKALNSWYNRLRQIGLIVAFHQPYCKT